ncbi:MAG: hypothetical protein IJY20_07660 [Clostridia bacterium]|nr:hypothetical protein [Clostridia bacterium]
MKKKIWIPLLVVIAVLLVAGTVLAIWLLMPKKLTKERLISTVNQTVALLGEGIPLNQESPYARLEEWLADREMGITCRAEHKLDKERIDKKWDCKISLKDGNVYVQQSIFNYDFLSSSINKIYSLRSNLFTSVQPKDDNSVFAAEITELNDPDVPSHLQLDLPAMTEEDVTEGEGELIIGNDYISRFLIAVVNGMPSETIDATTLSAIKTAIPGVIENLGLRAAIKTDGDFLYAVSLSFAANEELRTMLQLPTDADLSGELLFTVKSKEESTLFLSLSMADRLSAELSTQTFYAHGKPQTCHLSLDMFVKEGFANTSYHAFEGTAKALTFYADESTSVTATIDLSTLGKEERLPPLEGSLSTTRELARIFVNGEETSYNDLPRNLKDSIDASLVKKERASVTVTHEEEQLDTITWSSNIKNIPWTAAKITVCWNEAPAPITLPENHLNVLENPQPYATTANDIHKFLVNAGALDHVTGNSAVYRMDDLFLIVTVSKIGEGENRTTKCSFTVSDYMPGGHDEVIFKNGNYTFAYLDAIN